MKKSSVAALIGVSAGLMGNAFAQSEGCSINRVVVCYAGEESCHSIAKSPVTWGGIAYPPTGNPQLRICFANSNHCIQTGATTRQSADGHFISIGILQNPKEWGGYPKKIFSSFTYSQNEMLPSQLILYFESIKGKSPTSHLMTGECSSIGRKSAK